MNLFSKLGLPESLSQTVLNLGYTEPTPVQREAIPYLLQGRDVLAAAQTGTGKTAAFALPILTKLIQDYQKSDPKTCRVLILAPTRELAAQIEENIRQYAHGTKLATAVIFGGVSLLPQKEILLKGVDILVATPGRLLDHIAQGNLSLKRVHSLVLDEADRMLDMGFIHDIRKVLALIPKQRQTLLFSATFSSEILKLAKDLLSNPAIVEIAKNKESALITQEAYLINKKRKRELVRDLIVDNHWDQVLIFTRMKHAANRLAEQLVTDGLTAAAIHGNKSQSARTRALSDFKEHRIQVLVATDIAARGLDIEALPHVINYELPAVAEDYVHRIGRTGRASVPGHAVSLVANDETEYLRAIEKLLKKRIPTQVAKGYDGPVPEDIALDNKRRDEARSNELRKMKEARRRNRQKAEEQHSARKKTQVPGQSADKEKLSEDPNDRFEAKIVRKRSATPSALTQAFPRNHEKTPVKKHRTPRSR